MPEYRIPERVNLCKSCKWAKDQWHEACFCTYYGYIVSRGKSECWGHEDKENEEDDPA